MTALQCGFSHLLGDPVAEGVYEQTFARLEGMTSVPTFLIGEGPVISEIGPLLDASGIEHTSLPSTTELGSHDDATMAFFANPKPHYDPDGGFEKRHDIRMATIYPVADRIEIAMKQHMMVMRAPAGGVVSLRNVTNALKAAAAKAHGEQSPWDLLSHGRLIVLENEDPDILAPTPQRNGFYRSGLSNPAQIPDFLGKLLKKAAGDRKPEILTRLPSSSEFVELVQVGKFVECGCSHRELGPDEIIDPCDGDQFLLCNPAPGVDCAMVSVISDPRLTLMTVGEDPVLAFTLGGHGPEVN